MSGKQDPSTTGCRTVDALIKFLDARDDRYTDHGTWLDVCNELAAAINGVSDKTIKLGGKT
jgi:hypothetical protein